MKMPSSRTRLECFLCARNLFSSYDPSHSHVQRPSSLPMSTIASIGMLCPQPGMTQVESIAHKDRTSVTYQSLRLSPVVSKESNPSLEGFSNGKGQGSSDTSLDTMSSNTSTSSSTNNSLESIEPHKHLPKTKRYGHLPGYFCRLLP
jgi:hypothetical protein